jgi:3-methyladenine DNA glycosylase Mpg
VAPELLGRLLARRRLDGTILRARIVEVEAYSSCARVISSTIRSRSSTADGRLSRISGTASNEAR